MIFLHLIIGIILGKIFGNYTFFILGSIAPDIDHIYILIKNKLFSPRKIIDSMKYEEKYSLKFKTPLIHSFLGIIIISAVVLLIFNKENAFIFAIAYLIHLLMDWLDIDDKYYLYPLKVKFKGFLPIWSKIEKILTLIGIILLILLFTNII